VVTEGQVRESFARMAAKVDGQNAGDAAYKPLVANPDGAAYQAALDLVAENSGTLSMCCSIRCRAAKS
jgi:malate synthase